MNKKDLYIAESVSEGHPDKVCDQISDGILDAVLSQDKLARVACESFATATKIVISGEITTSANVDYEQVARDVLHRIGYTEEFGLNPDTYPIEVIINKQSPEISDLVSNSGKEEELGAGDQGIVVGYATNETSSFMPLHFVIATRLVKYASELRKSGVIDFAGPDMKSQVAIDKSDPKNPKIVSLLISMQHKASIDLPELRIKVKELVVDPVIAEFNMNSDFNLMINPAGPFVLGGPAADTGLTGRKLMIDTYGVSANHGGGAFSGKDVTKVDRSAAYMARYIAKNIVNNGIAPEAEVFLSYVIGHTQPFGINVWLTDNEEKREEIVELIKKEFDLSPSGIINTLDLRRPIYLDTASYGHFGREELNLPWERLDKNLKL